MEYFIRNFIFWPKYANILSDIWLQIYITIYFSFTPKCRLLYFPHTFCHLKRVLILRVMGFDLVLLLVYWQQNKFLAKIFFLIFTYFINSFTRKHILWGDDTHTQEKHFTQNKSFFSFKHFRGLLEFQTFLRKTFWLKTQNQK